MSETTIGGEKSPEKIDLQDVSALLAGVQDLSENRSVFYDEVHNLYEFNLTQWYKQNFPGLLEGQKVNYVIAHIPSFYKDMDLDDIRAIGTLGKLPLPNPLFLEDDSSWMDGLVRVVANVEDTSSTTYSLALNSQPVKFEGKAWDYAGNHYKNVGHQLFCNLTQPLIEHGRTKLIDNLI